MKSRVTRTIGSAAVIAGPMIERALDRLIAGRIAHLALNDP